MQSPLHFISHRVVASVWQRSWQSLKHCLYCSNSVWALVIRTAAARTRHSTNTAATLLDIINLASLFFLFFVLSSWASRSFLLLFVSLFWCKDCHLYWVGGFSAWRMDRKLWELCGFWLWSFSLACANFVLFIWPSCEPRGSDNISKIRLFSSWRLHGWVDPY